MTTRTKLFEDVKANINHKLNELTIDDLLDQKVLKKEFNNALFNSFLQDGLISEEEEENNLLRQMELLKRDMLLNFTSNSIGQEIPNMSNNHSKVSF